MKALKYLKQPLLKQRPSFCLQHEVRVLPPYRRRIWPASELGFEEELMILNDSDILHSQLSKRFGDVFASMAGDFQPLMRRVRRVQSCTFRAAFVTFFEVDEKKGVVLVDEADDDDEGFHNYDSNLEISDLI